ncbi:hypothetical protein J9S84_004592 [Salmonella enterica]|uniref:hypothetical protein n=1 Tax=Salmonella enterica TaxID=28901 RepID=UPI00097362A6|nr:hypothetical protein [Salmonella enterica]EBE2904031.1 hypothetical protein [Salmonella enterica subsp. enterica serovar Krefeld]EDQ2558352.1 hypothetical protein [Salmonella enterica subsp. enterica serovar Langensalza]EDT5367944.1 hypothetical protein [Salmonella enterica subsp. enterica]APY72368.1 hypothetical protein LFZ24_08470 [Salmonella enterica subsp. enterica serovar Krefeld str. SA20030536]EAY9603180.1 hypothetical protein [Salmonella enterica]
MFTRETLGYAVVDRLEYIFATTDSVKELRDAYKYLSLILERNEKIEEAEEEEFLARYEELKRKIKADVEGDE